MAKTYDEKIRLDETGRDSMRVDHDQGQILEMISGK